MKKHITFLFLVMAALLGQAQTIAPALLKEMGQRRDDEKIRVFVIMRQQYDQTLLNDRAQHFETRSERRNFVVNELKQFAEVTQNDLRHTLYEMERNAMVSEPKVLWIANAICFEATQQAIYDLASRTDIEVIGFDVKCKMTPEDETPKPASNMREITPNVIQVGANQVWDLGYTGQNVVVAVVDGGVDYRHLDLADHLWDGGSEFPHHGYDVGEDDNDPMDTGGHGTHCAGTVCGDGTAGSQTGMAPDATLMCVKMHPDEGDVPVSLLCFAFQWVAEHGGDVISCSQGWYDSWVDAALKELCRNTCVNVLTAGVIASIAAGNEGRYLESYPVPYNIRYPGACPPPYLDPDQQPNSGGLSCTVSVGAVDYDDVPAEFTSYGPSTWTNTIFADYPYTEGNPAEFGLIRPDVCAPGVDIKSTKYNDISGYTNMSGTSMATPCVAGCMALMLSKNPNLMPADVCRILEETSLQITESKSNVYGCGRVDVLSAVKAVQAGPLSLSSYVINDSDGNNDHQLNAGESIGMGLNLTASSSLSGAIMTLTINSEDVTITNGTLTLPAFSANQTQTVNGFTFVVNDNVPVKRRITFFATISVGGEEVGSFGFTLAVKGATLAFEKAMVVNDSNGNGILEAGENANLRVFIVNNGNHAAGAVAGILSTSNQHLTINTSERNFGSVAIQGEAWADFSVSLTTGAPASIPLTLTLTDEDNQQTSCDFNLCTVTLYVSPYGSGTASGTGSYGSGSIATLSATPNENYMFKRWKKGESTVSYLSPYHVAVTESANYIAEFEPIPSNCFVVGTPENTGAILPSQSFYNYSLTQQIYTAEELGLTEATDLSSIAFFNTGTEKTRKYRIYMVNTDKAAFTSGTDWIVPSPTDMVFDGNVRMVAGSWTTLYFNKAFTYDGLSNIAIIIDDNTGSYSRGMSCRKFSTSDFQAIHTYADHTDFNPYNPPTTEALRFNDKNQIILGIASYDYTVTVSAAPADGGAVSVQEGPFYYGQPVIVTATPTGDNVFYYWSENGERVSSDATYSFVVTASRNLVAHFGLPVTISVVANPEEGGSVEGACSIGIGQPCTVSATSNTGYLFDSWTVGGTPVSYTSDYHFYVEGATTLVANFDPLPENAIAVGQATNANTTLPTYSYYNYSLTEQIYNANEIGRACNITSIAFFNTTYEKIRNIRIYLLATTKQKFTSANNWIVPTNSNRVFSGNVAFAVNEWTTITLDTPFAYNGTSNLVLIVDDNSGAWDNNYMSFRVYDANDTQTLRIYNDNTNYNPLSPSNYNGTLLSVKNQIVFGIEGPDDVEDVVSTPVTVFPNPAVSELQIIGKGIRKVEVHNILGQRIETVSAEDSETIILNLETYETGLYVLTIHALDGVTTRKFVKQNK
jgi:subtilisin family serine protease